MTKLQVQEQTSKNGKPLELNQFTWDEETKTFFTKESNVTILLLIDSATITAGNYAKITAGNYAKITAGNYATISSGNYATITAGNDSHAVRRDIFKAVALNNQTIQFCPYEVYGNIELIDKKWYLNGGDVEHIIADGILSKVISTKGTIRKVQNYNKDTESYNKESYLIEQDGQYSHGETLKEAKDDLVYKLLERDTSNYEEYTIETVLKVDEVKKIKRNIQLKK